MKNLKEIPWPNRQKRKEYIPLTTVLRENYISYTRLVPEGILFTYKIQRNKINSTLKAEDLLKKHGENLKRKGGKTKRKEEGVTVEPTQDISTESEVDEEEKEATEQLDKKYHEVETRKQRQKRNYQEN